MKNDVTRFLILSPPRVGTHMLRSALLSHPQIIVQTELFNPYHGEFHPYPLEETSENIINNFAFKPVYEGIKAIGFPINEHHCNNELGKQWIDVWEKLRNLPGLKVIHLNRKNLLEAAISRITAGQVHQWSLYPNNAPKNKTPIKIRIEPKMLESIFVRNTNRYKYFHEFFSGHPMLEVLYENQCSRANEEYLRVQEFLGVDPVELAPSTSKQAKQSKSEALTNFYELKNYFSGSEWEDFFK